MSDYREFIEGKSKVNLDSGIHVENLSPVLFPFQRDLVAWALRKGRAALWADTGLGKTLMQLEWSRHAGKRVLIFAPLAVAEQTIRESAKLGMVPPRFTRVPVDEDGIWITNYANAHKFVGHEYDAIVLDESSILASIDGKTRTLLLSEFTAVPMKLCCTATPAPNDVSELANHAEFLGVMTRAEFLAHFFIHDTEGRAGLGDGWRLKGHAREKFWQWVAHWAAYVRKPSDIGHSDEGYNLPPLLIRDEIVDCESVPEGELFAQMSGGIQGRFAARKKSIALRVQRAAEIINASDEQWLVWHALNEEGYELAKLLKDHAVLIEGATPDDKKIAMEFAWRNDGPKTLIVKPSIMGYGLNWQHCHNMLFLGLSDSWQQYYQSIRRCWRFGQTEPVNVVVVTSSGETAVSENIRRKESQAADLAAGIIAAVRRTQMDEIRGTKSAALDYSEDDKTGDGWRIMLGDSIERVKEIETASVGLTVFSPPFASLYTYSASDRDMGNSRDYDEFFRHFDYLIPELLRITIPGRRACVHVQQITTTKTTHGVIGWRDFRADVVRHFIDGRMGV